MNFTCSIEFETPTSTRAVFSPPKPADGIFTLGDTITFTSTQSAWRVRYMDSPFDPPGSLPRFFGGALGDRHGATTIRGGSRFPFQCILIVGTSEFGWGDGGDQTPVKPPDPPPAP